MRVLDRRRWLGLVPVLLGLAAGCGDGGGSQSAGGPDDSVLLQNFAEDYRMYSIGKKQPPRKIDDLTKALGTMASPAVASARNGDIVVQWGATLPDTKEEPGQ